MLQFRVDGLILAGSVVTVADMEHAAQSAAVVSIGSAVQSTVVDTVNNDDAVGARLAVDHLVALGHRRIAHVGGGRGAGAAARLAGYEAAMVAHGAAAEIAVSVGDFSEAGGARAAVELLARDRPPTAIFAANDISAAGALNAVLAAGLQVPSDMSVVGYDNTGLAAMRHLSLTSVDQPRTLLGSTATQLLIERLEGGRTDVVHHVVAPTLVVRRSTSAPRPD
jgi:DNA-binding LacI/PurR family transcriptional regulator